MARMFNPPLALRLDVARRCVARIGAGARRTHTQARLSAPDLLGGGAAPLVFAADEEEVHCRRGKSLGVLWLWPSWNGRV